ncbi:MAG: extensin family protein [Dinoroseobacter sp.]|nr:extensin family protein [Dinoroseobacter sp.]
MRITRPSATPANMGRICGSREIIGRPIPPVTGKLRGCGVKDPVQVVQVSGVTLSQGSTMTCEAAQALNEWVDRGLKPAVGRMGGGVESLRVVAHYSCRTRNNKTGARVSEHGKGRAIDISDIRLTDGTGLSVLKHWGKGKKGTALKKAHRAACGPFGTVLGPNADRYHRDHFHFDVARHRSGPYCR